ncbi:MAG: aldo/keto reductase [delta proteobacterium ML8_F1]|nr:MAG: aldo/keto reductase [delta proteobacterium ML8_F1]
MEKRRLGKTEMMVSLVGLGGIPLQRVDQEQATQIIKAAHESGINFIDTARAYSVSESLIGNALETLGLREEFYLATKSMHRIYSAMKSEIETSLKNLKTDYIDLYQVHLIKTKKDYDTVMSEEGAYRALLEAKAEGKIRFIGITGHDAKLIEGLTDPEFFDTVQFPYNPVEPQGEPVFRKAVKHDMGTIVMKPVAGGAITDVPSSLKWIKENPDVFLMIPGMDSVEQVIENVRALETPLEEVKRRELEAFAKELGTEFCRRCGYCLPCPMGIDIPTMFLFEGYLKRYNLGEWSRERYSSVENKASACIKCGICETRCPYDLPIIKMMKRVAETFE